MKLITGDTQFATSNFGEFGTGDGCGCSPHGGPINVDLTATGLSIDRARVGIDCEISLLDWTIYCMQYYRHAGKTVFCCGFLQIYFINSFHGYFTCNGKSFCCSCTLDADKTLRTTVPQLYPRDISSLVQARVDKFGPKVQKHLGKDPPILGVIDLEITFNLKFKISLCPDSPPEYIDNY